MNDYEVAIAVADSGAKIVRQRFGKKLDHFNKGNDDFATNADIEAENTMLAILRRERPNDAILGEESGHSGSSNSVRKWLLDPLCGTLNYSVKMPIVAVNVALWSEGKCIAAAVSDPFNNDMFWIDDKSAYVRVVDKDILLSPSSKLKLVDINLDPPFPSSPNFNIVKLVGDDIFSANFKPRVVSSSMALTWVASGQRAGYITDGYLHESVHFSAGIAICKVAGCTITDLRGREINNNTKGLIAAADSDTHTKLLNLVKKNTT